MGKQCKLKNKKLDSRQLELFWPAFSCIRTEYGEIRNISPYLVRMPEIGDLNNGHVYGSVYFEKAMYRVLDERRNVTAAIEEKAIKIKTNL